MPPTALLVAGAAILSSVASLIVAHAEAWPEDMPSRSYYDRIWDSDPRLRQARTREQYRAAVLRFYSGTAREPGWNRRRAEILAFVGPDRAADLDLLGRILSAEAAKPESLRHLSPRARSLWEKDLRDVDRLAELLDRVGDDVRTLLDGDLAPSSLTPDRWAALALTKGVCR